MRADFERVMDVFGMSKVQEFFTIEGYLQRENIDVNALREHVRGMISELANRLRKEEETRAIWSRLAPKCPECNAPLLLRRIGFPPGRGNLKGYRSEWYCINGECIFERFNATTYQEELKKYGLDPAGRLVRQCNQEK